MPIAADFEKLGVFYLGRPYDWQQKKAQDGLILYDSKDLVTHAVCVGMTGSGKTGLCLALIEEAAIDGIPAILIDPKGDLANLLLTFPELEPEDFRPWVNEDDARRKNLSVDDYAAPAGRAVAEGARGLGRGRRAHPAPARRGGLRDLHARQQRGHPALDPEIVRGPTARHPRGRGAAARADRHHRHQPARPPRHRRRSDQEPRAHPARDDPGYRMARTSRTSTWPASSSRSRRRR